MPLTRFGDGSAGDADYGRVGDSYSAYRRPDPRIAAQIVEALNETHRHVRAQHRSAWSREVELRPWVEAF